MPERAILGYDPQFDINDYRRASGEDIPQLHMLKRHNLETMLGERFNVELSQVSYFVENGQLKSPDHNEPFLEIVKRGQEYRLKLGSRDALREAAEVEGFAKVQQILTDLDSQPEKKVIVISPKGPTGSIYQHNFFDVYSKNPNGQITMSRYTSKLSYQEFRQAATLLDPFTSLPASPMDTDFLKSPLETYRSVDEILEILHPSEKTMPLREYQKLIEACMPLILAYINALAQGSPVYEIGKIYNALLNYADNLVLSPKTRLAFDPLASKPPSINHLVADFGWQPVRPVAAGCGGQSGFSNSPNIFGSPFSVSEFSFGQDQYGTLEIHCEECGATYSRDKGKLEKSCRNCGGKKGIVC